MSTVNFIKVANLYSDLDYNVNFFLVQLCCVHVITVARNDKVFLLTLYTRTIVVKDN